MAENAVIISVNNKSCKALVDSGASRNCISEHFLKVLRIPYSALNRTDTSPLTSANNASMTNLGSIDLSIKAQGLTFIVNFCVLRNLGISCILGVQFLRDTQAVLTCAKKSLSLFDGLVNLPLICNFDRNSVLLLKSATTIPARSERFVPVILHPKYVSQTLMVEGWPSLKNRMVAIAGAIISPDSNTTYCRIVNAGFAPKRLKARSPIATVSRITIDAKNNSHLLPNRPQHCMAMTEEILPPHTDRMKALNSLGIPFQDTALAEDQLSELSSLLYRNRDLFATNDLDMPGSNVIDHQFTLDTTRSINTRQFRQPPYLTEELKKHSQRLLDAGIVQRSTSPYNSPCFLVKKSSGEFRFVIDLRKINEHIVESHGVDLPNIEDVCLQIGYKKPQFFSKIDLRSGYHQLRLHPDSRKFTSFSSPIGKLEFTKLPQGCKTSGSAFINAMTSLFGEELYDSILAYIDDLALYSSSAEGHFQLLNRVLDKFRFANLRLSPTKCAFFVSKMLFLGFEISESGVRIDPQRYDALRSYPNAKTPKEVRSMLGLFSYFRRHCPLFSKITAPLRQLITKEGSVHFRWTNEHSQALQKLKDAVLENATLIFPDLNEQFTVWTDACKTGLSYALSQKHTDGTPRFVAFAGRATRSFERNYGSTDLELTALLAALKEFRPYLLGNKHPVIIKTDHISLSVLNGLSTQKGKYLRFAVQLQEFNLLIEHIPGKQLFVDHLSRRQYPEPTDQNDTPELEMHTHDYLNAIDTDMFSVPTEQPKRKRKCTVMHIKPIRSQIIAPVITRRQAARAQSRSQKHHDDQITASTDAPLSDDNTTAHSSSRGRRMTDPPTSSIDNADNRRATILEPTIESRSPTRDVDTAVEQAQCSH